MIRYFRAWTKPDDKGNSRPRYYQQEAQPGSTFRDREGDVHVVADDGSVHNTTRPRGTKKERRRAKKGANPR